LSFIHRRLRAAVIISFIFPVGVFAQNLVTNPGFAGSLSGWATLAGSCCSSYDTTLNAPGSPGGSAKIINDNDQSNNPACVVNPTIICVTVFTIVQFVPVTPGTQYDYGGKVFIPLGQSSSGYGEIGLSFWNSNDNFIDSGASPNMVTTAGAWLASGGTIQAPAGAAFARRYFIPTSLAMCQFKNPSNATINFTLAIYSGSIN